MTPPPLRSSPGNDRLLRASQPSQPPKPNSVEAFGLKHIHLHETNTALHRALLKLAEEKSNREEKTSQEAG